MRRATSIFGSTAFGAPLQSIDQATFAEIDIVFQIGVPPIRVDIMTGIDGVSFFEAWPNRIASAIGGVPVALISRDDLLRKKIATGRHQDLADVERLTSDED